MILGDGWSPIHGAKWYQISQGGFVRESESGRVLPRFLNRGGYWVCRIIVDGCPVTLLVHRVVATTFIPNPHSLAVVNHIDGDKTNADVDNLEWVTPRANAIHAVATGLRLRRPRPRMVQLSTRITAQSFEILRGIVAKRRASGLPKYGYAAFLKEGVDLLERASPIKGRLV